MALFAYVSPPAESTIAKQCGFLQSYAQLARGKIITEGAKTWRACIRYHGLDCSACGFNFDTAFGALGENFIHVHHIVPIGAVGAEYAVDPIKDLIPVCPNCHAMIHRVNSPLTLEQLRNILRE